MGHHSVISNLEPPIFQDYVLRIILPPEKQHRPQRLGQKQPAHCLGKLSSRVPPPSTPHFGFPPPFLLFYTLTPPLPRALVMLFHRLTPEGKGVSTPDTGQLPSCSHPRPHPPPWPSYSGSPVTPPLEGRKERLLPPKAAPLTSSEFHNKALPWDAKPKEV